MRVRVVHVWTPAGWSPRVTAWHPHPRPSPTRPRAPSPEPIDRIYTRTNRVTPSGPVLTVERSLGARILKDEPPHHSSAVPPPRRVHRVAQSEPAAHVRTSRRRCPRPARGARARPVAADHRVLREEG